MSTLQALGITFRRMNADATLKALVGTNAGGVIDAQDGWPPQETDWQATDVWLTYVQKYGATVKAVGEYAVDINVFVARRAGLGLEVAGQIGERLLVLFHGADSEGTWWNDDTSGKRVHSIVVDEEARPSSFRDPVHFLVRVALRATD